VGSSSIDPCRCASEALALSLLALAGLLTARLPAALAQSSLDKARIYFDAGVQAYGAGRYAAAVEAFTEAYGLAPKPTVLFSLAQAERRQFTAARDPRYLRDAVAHFHRYLDQIPEGGRRADAVDALAELDVMGGHLDAAALAGASSAAPATAPQARLIVSTATRDAVISVDGVDHQELPVIQALTAGKHRVHASAPGYVEEDREITAVQGLVIPLEFVLQERPAYLDIGTTEGALITLDGHRAGTAPLGALINLTPGSHLVLVTKTGCDPHAETITLERGETLPVRVTLRPTRQRAVAHVTFGVGAAALVSAAALGGAAVARESTVRGISDAAKTGNISQTQLDTENAALAARDRLRVASFATLGAAAALGLAGAGLFVFDDPQPTDAPPRALRILPRSLSLVVSPNAAALGLRGSF
jgi:hypothetical protein